MLRRAIWPIRARGRTGRIIDAPLTTGEGSGCDPRAIHGQWEPSTPPPAAGFTTRRIAAETAPLYEKVKRVIPPSVAGYAPLISAINKLKKQKNAVILAHNYMTSEIFHCVGDFRGDSLQLAREAARTPR